MRERISSSSPLKERERERELRSRRGSSEAGKQAGGGSFPPPFDISSSIRLSHLLSSSYHPHTAALFFLSAASPLIHLEKKKKKGSWCIGFWYGYESARFVFDWFFAFGCPSGIQFLRPLIRFGFDLFLQVAAVAGRFLIQAETDLLPVRVSLNPPGAP